MFVGSYWSFQLVGSFRGEFCVDNEIPCVAMDKYNLYELAGLVVQIQQGIRRTLGGGIFWRGGEVLEDLEATPELVCKPFSSNSIVFNENSIASIIAVLLQQ